MTLKRLFFWFWTTLFIGVGASFILGFVFQTFLGNLSWIDLLLLGSTFSSVSLLGFFCYLVFQWLAVGLIGKTKIYRGLLLTAVAIVIIYLLYMCYFGFSESGRLGRLSIPFLIVIVSIFVGWLKVKWTNRTAFIPTLFFMSVVTTLESIPSINPKGEELPIESVLFTIFILLLCNAWQILQLHRLTSKKEKS